MAMCMRIFHDDTPIKWVRATYVTEDQLGRPGFYLHRSFLHSAEQPPATIFGESPFPPIFTVTPQTVEPRPLASDIIKVDSIRAQDPESPPAPVPESVRNRVLGSRDTRPKLRDSKWQEKHYRQCSYGLSNVSKDRGLAMCASTSTPVGRNAKGSHSQITNAIAEPPSRMIRHILVFSCTTPSTRGLVMYISYTRTTQMST